MQRIAPRDSRHRSQHASKPIVLTDVISVVPLLRFARVPILPYGPLSDTNCMWAHGK